MYNKLRSLMFPTGANGRITLALLILRLFVGVTFIQHGTGNEYIDGSTIEDSLKEAAKMLAFKTRGIAGHYTGRPPRRVDFLEARA